MKSAAIALILIGLVSTAHAQPNLTGAAVMTVEKIDDAEGKLWLQHTVIVQRPVVETTLDANGQRVESTFYAQESQTRQQVLLWSEANISTAGGKKLTPADAAKTLKPGQAVIILANGATISKEVKSLLRDDAMILEMKTPPPR